MSRSYRRTPMGPITTNESNKEYKRIENGRKRRKEKVALQDLDTLEKNLPGEKEFGDEWASPRDGKGWYDDEAKIRKDIEAAIKVALNSPNTKHSFRRWRAGFDYYLLEELFAYTKTKSVNALLKVPDSVINEFIKKKARRGLRK